MHFFLYLVAILALRRVLASDVGCGIGYLSCDNGNQCVQSDKWCDGINNCEDKSDEAYCKKGWFLDSDPNKCSDLDTHFWCSDGICVPISARCNNNYDCKDNSDEEECVKPGTTEGRFATTEYESDILTEEKDEQTERQYISSEYQKSTSVEEEAMSTIQTTREKQSFEDELTDATYTTVPSETMEITPPSVQVHPHSPSSLPHYYDMRMKEANNGKKSKVATATLPTLDYISSESHSNFRPSKTHYSTLPFTTPIPQVRQSINLTRPAVGYSTSTHNRGLPTHGSHSTSHYSNPQIFDSSTRTYDSRQRTYDSGQRTYDSRPRTYDSRQSTHDSRQPTYDSRQPTYDSRPRTYDGRPHTYDNRPRTYDGRQPTYDSRSSSYNSHPRTYDNHPSIFANRPYHPNGNQPVSSSSHRLSVPHDNRPLHTLNGEPEKTGGAILRSYNRKTEVNKPFYFAKNYAGLNDNDLHLLEGKDWLLRQRRDTGDWGKDTARALTAFALVNNSFPSTDSDSELMKRRFMVQLGIDLLRNAFPVNRMAMAMNALLAVCENPRDFHGLDLTEILRAKIRKRVKNQAHLNPFVYLSLCLAGQSFSSLEVDNLMKQMKPSGILHEMAKDMQSLAIQAFACYLQQSDSDDHGYQTFLRETLHSAVSDLLQRTGDDGSFGSVYSTALAAQALISVNNSESWNAEKTLSFLKSQQREDGSFGDLLATYYVLPVLSGRSLLHLRNIRCKPPATVRDLTPSEILEFAGPKQYIHYSVYFGHPLENSHSVRVLVPQGINFLDVMRVAEYQDNNFRFAYEDKKNIYVYSISGIPNDSERGFSWHLYVKRDSDQNQKDLNTAERYNENLKEYFPKADEHVIFWYHLNGLRN